MIILPSAYLPSVEWFAYAKAGDCTIDLGEHFIKRSERNRTRILAPDGVMDLSAQVRNANRPRTPMRDMKLDYSKRWQHQHWGALVASYKGSPYFDYYAELIEPFYRREWKFLIDYNLEITRCLCRAAGVAMPAVSDHYITAADSDLDLRPKQKEGSAFVAEPYFQVFSDRQPFAPNLSFIDLLFAEGPESISTLAASLRAR